jgi:uncharacterized protein YlxW (UPF0749 family)
VSDPRPGRTILAATARASRWQAGLAGLLALVGFVVVLQVRTVWQVRRTLQIPPTELEQLALTLRDQERRRASLEAEIAALRARLQDYEKAAAEGRTAAARLTRTLQDLRARAGVTPVEGPGVVVELNDNPRPPRPGEDPNKTILHYSDLYAVVADLWAAGADAVAVNGERVVSSTGINCVGTTILCNAKRLAPPYVITAIGDPDVLLAALRRPGGAVEMLMAFGFPVRIAKHARLHVPGYRGIYRFEHVRVPQ